MPLRLSEAVRDGAALRPQAFGQSFNTNEQGEWCSCALGAAYEAICAYQGRELRMSAALHTYGLVPLIRNATGVPMIATEVRHPVTDQLLPIVSVISGLNDQDRWPREDIANWLEKQGF